MNIQVSEHGRDRIRERCGIKPKSADRIAQIVFEKGLQHAETNGELNRYLTSLYYYNETANNLRLYGDKVYIFCNDVLVTVLDTPKKYLPVVNKLMRRRENHETAKPRGTGKAI